MAFGNDSNPFLIKEGTLSVGTWTAPEDIGTNLTAPSSFFSGDVIGYIQQGTINVVWSQEFAEFRSNTPGILIRKDLIYKPFGIEFAHGQFNGDVMELLKDTLSQKAYGVTIPSAQTWDIHHIGSDSPTPALQGFQIDTELTDGSQMIIGIYSGRMTSEDIGTAFSGTDYAVNNGKIEAFPTASFAGASNETQKHYGIMAIRTA